MRGKNFCFCVIQIGGQAKMPEPAQPVRFADKDCVKLEAIFSKYCYKSKKAVRPLMI